MNLATQHECDRMRVSQQWMSRSGMRARDHLNLPFEFLGIGEEVTGGSMFKAHVLLNKGL